MSEPEPIERPAGNPLLAFVLVLLCSGGGTVYASGWRRAVLAQILMSSAGLLAAAVLLWAPLGQSAIWLAVAIIVVARLGMAADALRRANRLLPIGVERTSFWSTVFACVVFVAWEVGFVEGLRNTVARGYHIPTAAMSPSILPGDRIVEDRLTLAFRPPRRGEIVVHYDLVETNSQALKRVIGLPGDTVEIRENAVFVNGHSIDESHAGGDRGSFRGFENVAPIVVPDAHYYLLFDARYAAPDSRMHGPYPLDKITGIVRVVYWSRELQAAKPIVFGPPEPAVHGNIRWDRLGHRLDDVRIEAPPPG